jgi:hypothetical protein
MNVRLPEFEVVHSSIHEDHILGYAQKGKHLYLIRS